MVKKQIDKKEKNDVFIDFMNHFAKNYLFWGLLSDLYGKCRVISYITKKAAEKYDVFSATQKRGCGLCRLEKC